MTTDKPLTFHGSVAASEAAELLGPLKETMVFQHNLRTGNTLEVEDVAWTVAVPGDPLPEWVNYPYAEPTYYVTATYSADGGARDE